jgi:LysR family transcriptional regulator, hydrogen peroxide-inducible genes activator
MTLQQLEYAIALHTHGQFSEAAAHCHVSQPSLSVMIKKLEDELGTAIFDRRRQPIVATEMGELILAQARVVLQEARSLHELVATHRSEPVGRLHLGVIPTIAPYLMPLFIEAFSEKYPMIQLDIVENTTENLERMLKQGRLDACILATPPIDERCTARPLYSEAFVAYAPHEASLLGKNYVLAEDIDPEKLLLMEEGHCIREQIINLCALRQVHSRLRNIHFEAGNLETLRRLVEAHSGITILPQMALLDLDEDRMQYVRFFKDPAPVREVTLVAHNKCPKQRLLDVLATVIVENLPHGFG